MSTTLLPFDGFNPIAAEWARQVPARRAATLPRDAGAVGYRGGPLPGLPVAQPAASRWRESLLRWIAEMPREMPPRD